MCETFDMDRIQLPGHKTPSCKMEVRVRLRMLKSWGTLSCRLIEGSILSSFLPNPVTRFHVTSLSRIRAPLVAKLFVLDPSTNSDMFVRIRPICTAVKTKPTSSRVFCYIS
jgi:hypothetical protein